jgi:hypothetical protein
MNRLPQYDSRTRSFELGAFVSLGLIAIILIGFALRDAGQFAQERECIIDTLLNGQAVSVEMAGAPTNHSVTNLSGTPGRSRTEHAS